MPATVFEKDKKGNYTGVVDEYTFTFISLEAMVPQPSGEEQLSSITNVINSLNRFGVTSALDGAALIGHPHGHTQIRQLAKENRLNVRMPFIDLQYGDVQSGSLVDAEINAVTIIPGNFADFVLLNKDYFTIPDDEIKTISASLTVVNGRVVFGTDEFKNLSPKLPETLPVWSPFKYYGGLYNKKD